MNDLVEKEDASEDDAYDLKLRRETEAQQKVRVRRAWDVVCATPEGRAVLWDIMAMTGMAGSPMVHGFTDATAQNIGRGDVGRELQVKINDVGKRWALLMLKENI